MAKTGSLTQQRLKEVLHYDSETGIFTWAIDRPMAPKAPKGKVAGKVNSHGYFVICVDGVRHHAHRLAWMYIHGDRPIEIDHQNHIRTDNRLANLRSTDRSGNGNKLFSTSSGTRKIKT